MAMEVPPGSDCGGACAARFCRFAGLLQSTPWRGIRKDKDAGGYRWAWRNFSRWNAIESGIARYSGYP